MGLSEDHRALTRLHNSTNDAVEVLQEQNRQLLEENREMSQNLINCQKALDIAKENMRNALTMQNETKDTYVQEIQDLRAEIKRLSNEAD